MTHTITIAGEQYELPEAEPRDPFVPTGMKEPISVTQLGVKRTIKRSIALGSTKPRFFGTKTGAQWNHQQHFDEADMAFITELAASYVENGDLHTEALYMEAARSEATMQDLITERDELRMFALATADEARHQGHDYAPLSMDLWADRYAKSAFEIPQPEPVQNTAWQGVLEDAATATNLDRPWDEVFADHTETRSSADRADDTAWLEFAPDWSDPEAMRQARRTARARVLLSIVIDEIARREQAERAKRLNLADPAPWAQGVRIAPAAC